MVKKIVGDILEEEYDDMYFSMRTKEDLDLYKKANWYVSPPSLPPSLPPSFPPFLLEEEYDDMYFSMRTKEDLDLYKKANWDVSPPSLPPSLPVFVNNWYLLCSQHSPSFHLHHSPSLPPSLPRLSISPPPFSFGFRCFPICHHPRSLPPSLPPSFSPSFRQRAVNLVLGMLMGKGEESGGRDKVGREGRREGGREVKRRG